MNIAMVSPYEDQVVKVTGKVPNTRFRANCLHFTTKILNLAGCYPSLPLGVARLCVGRIMMRG